MGGCTLEGIVAGWWGLSSQPCWGYGWHPSWPIQCRYHIAPWDMITSISSAPLLDSVAPPATQNGYRSFVMGSAAQPRVVTHVLILFCFCHLGPVLTPGAQTPPGRFWAEALLHQTLRFLPRRLTLGYPSVCGPIATLLCPQGSALPTVSWLT